MVERKIRGRYFIALILTVAIFAIGVLVGSLVNSYKVSQIYNSEKELTTQFLTQGLYKDLLLENPCDFVNTNLVSSDLFKL